MSVKALIGWLFMHRKRHGHAPQHAELPQGTAQILQDPRPRHRVEVRHTCASRHLFAYIIIIIFFIINNNYMYRPFTKHRLQLLL